MSRRLNHRYQIPDTAIRAADAMTNGKPLSARRPERRHHLVILVILIALPICGAEFNLGCNLWNIAWGTSTDGQASYYNYFKKSVAWASTKDPWNPSFLSELKEARIRCIRFMDWGCTNGCEVTAWSQRIRKGVNHYNSQNLIPTAWGDGFGVAYEWMIDLCNRVSADMWVCVPHKADSSYSFELATLIKQQLDPKLKVYVEYSNEVWNNGFPQYNWVKGVVVPSTMPIDGTWQGRRVEQTWGMGDNPAKYVYRTCMVMNEFNKVFGVNSPRVVKVLAGFYALTDDEKKDNYLCNWHMYCVTNKKCNPWDIKIDAYAVAPYYGGCNESAMRGALAEDVVKVRYLRTSLAGTGIPAIGYEGGPDNYGCPDIAHLPFQEQLATDALNAYASVFEGIFNWYTFNGGAVWGFKASVGDSVTKAPRWRGLKRWLATQPDVGVRQTPIAQVKKTLPSFSTYNLFGQPVSLAVHRDAACGVYLAVSSGAHKRFAKIDPRVRLRTVQAVDDVGGEEKF